MVEITYSRIGLAIEQLDVALELFLRRRSYAAALTLAGAAEEVLGRALSLQGKWTILDQWHLNKVFADDAHPALSLSAYAFKINLDRNSLKHMHSLDESTVTSDLQESALWMLYRACANFEWLGFPATKRMRSFEGWFMTFVV